MYFLEQHATSFGNYFSDIKKKMSKKIAYTDLLQKETDYLKDCETNQNIRYVHAKWPI